MAKRKLFPDDYADRRVLIGSEVVILLVFVVSFTWWAPGDWTLVLPVSIGSMVGIWILIYFFQELPEDELGRYTVMIADIEIIGTKLNQLATFLEQERERVLMSEATRRTLEAEKAQLEPVVLMQRETVNAVLSAYNKNTASRIWKERALGFMSGVAASLVASLLFEVFKR